MTEISAGIDMSGPATDDVLQQRLALVRERSTDPTDLRSRPPRRRTLYSLSYHDDNEDVSPFYNRGIDMYEWELSPHFRVRDYVGQRILDIGAGAYDRFGYGARKLGVLVTSLNPALRNPDHRRYIQEAWKAQEDYAQSELDIDFRRKPIWERIWRGAPSQGPAPQGNIVAAVGERLPVASNSVQAVVSVYGIPHYLHHVALGFRDPDEARAAYTPEVRKADKALITLALGEIVRVLEPGGKAFLKDDHSAPGEFGLNDYSPTDGSEVEEVLDGLRHDGVGVAVHEQPKGNTPRHGVMRVIILEKP